MYKKKLKKILKNILPPILIKMYKGFRTPRKFFLSTIGEIECSKSTLYILGNGPSLLDTLKKNYNNIKHTDCMVVNHFCKTSYFADLRPNFYVIADPRNLGGVDDLADFLKTETVEMVEKLNKVDWNINLIVPDFAKDGYLVGVLKNNPLIKIFYYNTQDFSKYDNFIENWSENCVGVPAQTVLNACVYLGVFLGYKVINVLGMDMSWHEDLELDQKTNELYLIDKHFYGIKKLIATLDNNGLEPAKVHEYLYCSVRALKLFWDLRAFADYKGCKIYNFSPHSWVDAFERK